MVYQVGQLGSWFSQGFPRDEDENASHEKNSTESLEEIPNNGKGAICFGGRRGISAILNLSALDLFFRQAKANGRCKTGFNISRRYRVPLKVTEFYQLLANSNNV